MQLVTHPTPTPKLTELKKYETEIPDLSKKRMAISSSQAQALLAAWGIEKPHLENHLFPMWLLNQCNLRNIELTHPSLEVTIGTHLIGKLKDWRGDLLLCKPLSWLLIFKTPSTEKRLINTQGGKSSHRFQRRCQPAGPSAVGGRSQKDVTISASLSIPSPTSPTL